MVENLSDRSLTFDVYGADLVTAAGGGLAPAQPTATMHEAGAWIVVSSPVVTIAAHGQFTDTFTLTLPAAVFPGQHLGAVVAAAGVGLTPQGNPIEARTALITVVTVPGIAHPSARLSSLTGSVNPSGSIGFGITLSNTGNVLLTYAGTVAIDDATGHRVATLPLYAHQRVRRAERSGATRCRMEEGRSTLLRIPAAGVGHDPCQRHSGWHPEVAVARAAAPNWNADPDLVGVAVLLAALLLLVAWSIRRRAGRRSRLVARNILDKRLTGLQ